MSRKLSSTAIDGQDVILTAGMIDGATNERIYGMFADAKDARSDRADELALGTISASRLTTEQIELAERNSAAL